MRLLSDSQHRERYVNIQGIRPELVLAIVITNQVFQSYGAELIITSILNGRHSRKSLHYTGSAFDIRIKHLAELTINKIYRQLKESLLEDFDIILESNHIHIEYQPKR